MYDTKAQRVQIGLVLILAGLAAPVIVIFGQGSVKASLYSIIGASLFGLVCVILGIYTAIFQKKPEELLKNPPIPQTVKRGGAFQLEPGETVMRTGEVWSHYLGDCVLYLTTQRLFIEYFTFNLFPLTTKKSIEIPLAEITNVERASHNDGLGRDLNIDVKVEYQHIGQPGSIVFSARRKGYYSRYISDELLVELVRTADEWVIEIKKTSNLAAK